ncbi:unnamed protein product [Notodromas monacha]|uniref:Programmed cell death protein 4 n=1 Tax=Notodromas monacha TaxID=399045 RepID=A0A7R9GD00_9CRUS|nr:unnamed protein product [Notodromas monacha]CAG0916398.1 unnamed protein product [Notodromas monacha]
MCSSFSRGLRARKFLLAGISCGSPKDSLNRQRVTMADIEIPDAIEKSTEELLAELDEGPAPSAVETAEDKKKKHHKRSRVGSGGDSSEMVAVPNHHASQPKLELKYGKNSRRSRNIQRRGAPKKGGAGGKGVWGLPGLSELNEPEEIDRNDPNFDPDAVDAANVKVAVIVPEKTEEEFRAFAEPIFQEYFLSSDTEEAINSILETNLAGNRHVVVMLMIEMAMEHKASHRELASEFLSESYRRLCYPKDYAKAFDELLKNLPELVLDTPDAANVLGKFLARCIADDCLPPAFLNGYKGKVECEHARTTLNLANTLLVMKHGMSRLDTIWGQCGPTRPTKSLTRQIIMFLKEYLDSGDIQEAHRCLLELESPHFHHEVVYETVILALESLSESVEDRLLKLMKYFADAVVITPEQIKNGFFRVFDEMPDICLDVPPAYVCLERFVTKCDRDKIAPRDVVTRLPSRGRKRFVSEGDGGLLKGLDYISPYV